MNTVPVPKVDVVKRKSALAVDGKNLSVTLGLAANNPVWDFDCRECKANGYVVADAIKLEPVSTQTVSGLYFIHNDHLGTPKLLTNISGTVVWQQHTTPFGEITNTLATGIGNLKSFPGQYRDSETGYSYNYYRDYDPSLGRYVQSDPIGLNGGLNTYGYVSANPLSNSDPNGLIEWNGTYTSTGLSYSVAGNTYFTFELTSEPDLNGCVAKVTVKGSSGFAGAGISKKNFGVGQTKGTVSFIDSNIYVDHNVFDGFMKYDSIGINILGADIGKTSIYLGGAVSTSVSASNGFDIGVAVGIGGPAEIVRYEYSGCDCQK